MRDIVATTGFKGGSAEALDQLLAGIDAAALDPHDPVWLDLVVPSGSAEAIRAVIEHRAARIAARDSRDSGAKIRDLRQALAARGLDGLIIPRADEHQGEYVPGRAQRLFWATGFTGSAGLAIVLANKAAIFVDGRYTLQVRDQVDTGLFEIRHLTEQPATDWLATAPTKGMRIAADGRLHTEEQIDRYQAAAKRAGAEIVVLTDNPIDTVWQHQPPAPLGPIRLHAVAHAGRSSAEKRSEVGRDIARQGAAVAVLTQPDSLAWLLNVRGSDVPHTPLPLSFALVSHAGTVEWFVDPRKLVPGVREALGNDVSIDHPDRFEAALGRLGGQKVLVDPTTTGASIVRTLAAAGAEVVRGADPCLLPKACKNAVELDGTRAAHIRDGAAVSRFLCWLQQSGAGLGEIAVSDQLEAFRRAGEGFRDLSFPSISGAGSNGAIVHYRASPATERTLTPGELYLIDSGAQYVDGTTDITRTVAIGTPSDEHRDRFTRVLQGHIALATVRFPAGTTGSQLDVLARLPLWSAGLDYDHGTGHGVGSYLSVHEGPQRIAKVGNSVALKPGMILSNEPGYYKTGGYGIRVENLVVVREEPAPAGAERALLGFETLTLAPIDRALIAVSLLTPTERAWVDDYHARVARVIGPLVDPVTKAWLDAATAPLSSG